MGVLLLREICELTGVTRRAVQGYEKEGLMKPSSKNKQGYLLYDQEAVVRIKEIKSFEDMPTEDLKFVLTQKIFELKKRQIYLKSIAVEIQKIIYGL